LILLYIKSPTFSFAILSIQNRMGKLNVIFPFFFIVYVSFIFFIRVIKLQMFYVTCGCTWKADELLMTFLWHMPLCTGHYVIINQLFEVRGRTIAEVVSSGLSLWSSKLNPRPNHVGFVVAKVVLSQVSLWVLCFSSSVSFHEHSALILWCITDAIQWNLDFTSLETMFSLVVYTFWLVMPKLP